MAGDEQVPRIGDPESWAAWSQAVDQMFSAVSKSLAHIGAAASQSFGQRGPVVEPDGSLTEVEGSGP